MRSPTDSKYYISRSAFEKEQASLYSQYWINVGLTTQVERPYQFIVRKVGNLSIVIQNVEGELIAYQNSCPHRQMELQWEKSGQRPILCRYHGWSFDKTGKPKSIPHYDEMFQYTAASLNRLCLKKFEVRTVGKFIFVTLSKNPIELEKQFSIDLLTKMTNVSDHFDNEILQTSYVINANWKLLLDVIQDPNHVQFLHAKTFAKRRTMPSNNSRGSEFKSYPESASLKSFDRDISLQEMSSYSISVQNDPSSDWFEMVHQYESRSFYLDMILFPATHFISATGGHSFSHYTLTPLSENRTEIDMLFFTARRKDDRAKEFSNRIPIILLALARDAQWIFNEDVEGVESVHRGLSSGIESELGTYETCQFKMRKWFGDFYKNV